MDILVVEDEPRVSTLLARAFAAEGFRVDVAENGRVGFARAITGHYDLVVLDLVLPHVDGMTLLREVAARRPEMPVVILSARADLSTRLRGFRLGACDFVAKPFSHQELLARVRVHLSHSAVGDEVLMRAAGLVLDLGRRQARVGARLVDLSEREFRVLHHLVRNAGDVVSRDSIIADVWGTSCDPRSNVVDVCVRRLRRKLGADAQIETVRHGGYRVAA
jgi:two-component system, OmpR family, copper resistance phosphate regulon response regulator CusR